MSIEPSWIDIAARLACALIAGAIFGLNRSEHGRVAGLRTNTLVCLAACVSMIQVNLLLPLAGKTANSFIVMDLMRLPLGILSGMGFIGAGAIIHNERLVIGVTTVATLWFVTVIGFASEAGSSPWAAPGL
jgi:putative Mg2+ transporter-C (MgtC) family protein